MTKKSVLFIELLVLSSLVILSCDRTGPYIHHILNPPSGAPPSNNSYDITIAFPDEELRKVLYQAILQETGEEITQEEAFTDANIELVESVVAENRDITDLSGLEHFTSLEELVLDGNPISDLTPIAEIDSLRVLSLEETDSLDDLSQLSELDSLEELYLKGSDNISAQEIAELQADLSNLQIETTEPREAPLNLNTLVSDTALRDALHQAIETKIGESVPMEAIPPASIRQVTHLEARNAGITDLTGLEHFTSLEELVLDGNPISDLTPIAEIDSLRVLSLEETDSLDDLSQLSELDSLEELYLKGSDNISAQEIAELQADLSNLQIETTEPREAPLNLNTLVSDTALRDALHQAIETKIGESVPMETIPPASIQQVTHLEAGNAGIADLTGLEHFTSLEELVLDGNDEISNLTPIAHLTSLTNLSLKRIDTLSDLSPLYGLTSLKTLRLGKSDNISTQEIAELQAALPNLHIRGTP